MIAAAAAQPSTHAQPQPQQLLLDCLLQRCFALDAAAASPHLDTLAR